MSILLNKTISIILGLFLTMAIPFSHTTTYTIEDALAEQDDWLDLIETDDYVDISGLDFSEFRVSSDVSEEALCLYQVFNVINQIDQNNMETPKDVCAYLYDPDPLYSAEESDGFGGIDWVNGHTRLRFIVCDTLELIFEFNENKYEYDPSIAFKLYEDKFDSISIRITLPIVGVVENEDRSGQTEYEVTTMSEEIQIYVNI